LPCFGHLYAVSSRSERWAWWSFRGARDDTGWNSRGFPEHAIALETGDTPELVASLLHHRIDLALTLEVEKESQLQFHPLFTDELQFLVSPLHPWARAGRVERSEIPWQNHILYSKRSFTFRLIGEYFRREEMILNSIIEVGSMEATKELVKHLADANLWWRLTAQRLLFSFGVRIGHVKLTI
jgi:DNA-binding transcriptional LysR family regulator